MHDTALEPPGTSANDLETLPPQLNRGYVRSVEHSDVPPPPGGQRKADHGHIDATTVSRCGNHGRGGGRL